MKEKLNQMDLFSAGKREASVCRNQSSNELKAPLAHRVRPYDFMHFHGQEHIWKKYPFLSKKQMPSLIIWGPPGTGKTTLAHLLANKAGYELYGFNAVLGGVGELRKLIDKAKDIQNFHQTIPAIFIDEIHRFNKAQQDALLPYVEKGEFILIGATTENPSQSINRALLSRTQIIKLQSHTEESIITIITDALKKIELSLEEDSIRLIAQFSNGDVRQALNTIESLEESLPKVATDKQHTLIVEHLKNSNRWYDKNGQRHYDVTSAFIKSMRSGDVDGALIWLAIMLDGGEDPMFIARRLSIFAAEDVGNADPMASLLATSTLTAIEKIGMPEARIHLGQATTYLASTFKSKAAYNAVNEAIQYVADNPTIEVPEYLKNYPSSDGKKKREINPPRFYRPTELGVEKRF